MPDKEAPDESILDRINDLVEDGEILFWNRLFHKLGIQDQTKVLSSPVRSALSEAMHEAAVAALQQAGMIPSGEQLTVDQLELACRGLPKETRVTVMVDQQEFDVYATDFDILHGEFDIFAQRRKL